MSKKPGTRRKGEVKKAAPKKAVRHEAPREPEEFEDVMEPVEEDEGRGVDDDSVELDAGVEPTPAAEEVPAVPERQEQPVVPPVVTPTKQPSGHDLDPPHPLPPTSSIRTKAAMPGGSAAFVAPIGEERKLYLLKNISTLSAGPEVEQLLDDGLIEIVNEHVQLTEKGHALVGGA